MLQFAGVVDDTSGEFANPFSISNPLGLLGVCLVEAIQEPIDALSRDGLAAVAIEIIDCFELACGIHQSGDDNISEQRFRNRVETDFVKQATENKFRSKGSNRCVAKMLYEIEDHSVIMLFFGKQGVLFFFSGDETLTPLHQPFDLDRIACGTDRSDHAIAVGFIDNLNADRSRFIGLFSDKHTPILPTGHPKVQMLSYKIRTYSGFFGSVEVRKKARGIY